MRRRTIFSSIDTDVFDCPENKQLIVVEKDGVILEAGTVSPYLYCIRDGWCRVLIGTPDGKQRTLWYAGPGDMLGLSSICSGEKNSFSVVAVDKMTICRISAEAFRESLTDQNELSYRVAGQLSGEISRLEKQTHAIRIRTLQKEMARIILGLFPNAPDSEPEKKIPLAFFCKETDSGAEDVSNCLHLFSLGKLIRYSDDKMRIIDRDRLLLVAMNDEEWN